MYGIPEHASSLPLKSTIGPGAPYSEPYRLYTLDVFEYELDSPAALYGTIPFMVGHRSGATAGVFWFNPTETFVDVEGGESVVLFALAGLASLRPCVGAGGVFGRALGEVSLGLKAVGGPGGGGGWRVGGAVICGMCLG